MTLYERLRLFLFRPRWSRFSGLNTWCAYHSGYYAVVQRGTDDMYHWIIVRAGLTGNVVAEGNYAYRDIRHAKLIARAGLLSGGAR